MVMPRDAWTGFVSILVFAIFTTVGARIPGWAGLPNWVSIVGGVIGAVAGYLAAREALRWYWRRIPAEKFSNR